MIICYPSTRYGWDGWLLVHRTGWANLIVCWDEICQIPVAKIGSVGWIARIHSRKLLNIDPKNGLEDFRLPRFLLDFGCPAGCFFLGGAGWSYIAGKSGGWWNIKHGHPTFPGCEKVRYSHVDTSHWTCQSWFSKGVGNEIHQPKAVWSYHQLNVKSNELLIAHVFMGG